MNGIVGSTVPGIGDGVPRVEVVGLSWERPQLVIWLRSAGGSADAAMVRLVRMGDPAVQVAPTGSRREADLVGIRYNVMVGPGLRPLEPGRWHLRLEGVGPPASEPIVASGSVEVAAAARRFDLLRGTYRVTPVIDRPMAASLSTCPWRAGPMGGATSSAACSAGSGAGSTCAPAHAGSCSCR